MAVSDTAQIALRRKDGTPRAYALVDAADYDELAAAKWSLSATGYAQRSIWTGSRVTTVRMQREIMGLKIGDPQEVDHINGNRLDNRRCNLRVVDRKQQMQNQRSRGGSSRFRGVYWDERSQRWVGQVRVDGQTLFRFQSEDELEVARRVDAARQRLLPYAEPDPSLPGEGSIQRGVGLSPGEATRSTPSLAPGPARIAFERPIGEGWTEVWDFRPERPAAAYWRREWTAEELQGRLIA